MHDETLEYALRRLEKQNESILEEIHELKSNLPNVYISKEVYRSELADLERRVKLLEESSSKATWAILGAAGSILFTVVKTVLGM